MKSNKQSLLKQFEGKLNDDHLFQLMDLEVEEENRRAEVITGTAAEGFIINKTFDVQYLGKNNGGPSLRGAKENKALNERAERAIAAAKASIAELKDKAVAKIDEVLLSDDGPVLEEEESSDVLNPEVELADVGDLMVDDSTESEESDEE